MAKTLKTSPEGRKCTFPRCKRLLSIYNHQPYCHIHQDMLARARMVKLPYHHTA